MIDSSDISVVIQGAIIPKIIKKVTKSIRKNLPNAEIIISTWKETPLYGLDFDKIVLNKNVKAIPFRKNGQLHNLNRQIFSTFNGIKKAERKYILKIRSDIMLLNTNFLNYFDKFNVRKEKYRVFEKRILITNIYTRNSSNKLRALFHPSDWMMFGLASDMYKMWNIPLAKEPETSQWYTTHKKPKKDMFPDFLTRYHAEQYIWINALKTNGINVSFNNYSSYSSKLCKISEQTIFNNFVVLDYLPKFSFLNLKYPYIEMDDTVISFYDWLKYYKNNFDISFKIPFIEIVKNELNLKTNLLKFKKHFKRIFFPVNKMLNWANEIFSALFYIIKIPIDIVLKSWKYFVLKQ